MPKVDAPLPMIAAPMAEQPIEPLLPATREELVELVAKIGLSCKMPPGVKNARFVRLPSELFLEVSAIVSRELADFVVEEVPADAAAIAEPEGVIALPGDEADTENSGAEAQDDRAAA